jgi:transcriptional regulator with XRE-family HTH domain
MKREELINSPEYWLAKIQIDLFNRVDKFMKENKLNRTNLAEKLGVTKGYISQILNGDADHRLSKIVELSLAIGLVPHIQFEKIEDEVALDTMDALVQKYAEIEKSKKVLLENGYMITTAPTIPIYKSGYKDGHIELNCKEDNCTNDMCA